MAERLVTTKPSTPSLRIVGSTQPLLDTRTIAAALGAEPTGVKIEKHPAPLTLFVLRQQLFRRLQSSGGRPALSDTDRRAKIPLADAEWAKLEELAAKYGRPGFTPSAGQVASVLLSMSLQTVAAELADSETPFVQALADRVGQAAVSG